MRALLAALVLGASLLSAERAAAAETFTPELRAAIAGAAKEGSLSVTWGNILGGAAGIHDLERLVNAKYGTNLTFVYTPGPSQPEMAGRIAQEQAAGRPASTDLFGTSMAPDNAALFMPIDWRRYVPRVPENVMRFGQRGVAYATVIWGISYNSNLVPPEKVPKSLKDLLKPEWQGKIGVRITATDTGYLAQPSVLGPRGVLTFYRALLAQSSGLARCGSLDRIASGEFLFFFPDCGEGRLLAQRGVPVTQTIPAEGGAIFDWLAGIPKNAPHPNAAKLFIAYLLTPEGQQFVWNIMGADSERLPGSRMRPIIDSYRAHGIKFYNTYDVLRHDPVQVDASQKAITQLLQQASNR